MEKINPIITVTEYIGAFVVGCVGLGLFTSHVIFPYNIPFGGYAAYVLYVCALIVMVCTIYRKFFLKFGITPKVLTIMGLVLLLAGSSMAFHSPEYFTWAVHLPVMFWLRVSIYSIPAICMDGATFTLFIVWFENTMKHRPVRENLLTEIAFVMYASFTITANFLAINFKIPVSEHILLSKVVTICIIGITLGYVVILKWSLIKNLIKKLS